MECGQGPGESEAVETYASSQAPNLVTNGFWGFSARGCYFLLLLFSSSEESGHNFRGSTSPTCDVNRSPGSAASTSPSLSLDTYSDLGPECSPVPAGGHLTCPHNSTDPSRFCPGPYAVLPPRMQGQDWGPLSVDPPGHQHWLGKGAEKPGGPSDGDPVGASPSLHQQC